MEFLPSFRGEINGGGAKCRLFPQANNQLTSIPHSGNHKGDRYKLSAQSFLGSFGWKSITNDWLMVALNIIH